MRSWKVRPSDCPVLAVVGLSIIIRLAIALSFPAQTFYIDDSDTYLAAANDLLHGNLIRSIIVMPGYPALLALVGATPGAGLVLNIVLSAIGIWLLMQLTEVVTGQRIAGYLAGAIWAVYPFAIFYAIAGLTETLFVTLLLGGFLSYYRAAFTTGTILMVMAILTRPAVEFLTPVLIIVFAVLVHGQSIGRALRHCAIFLGVYLLLMTPWWVHNYAKYGSFVRLNLAFGVVLYTGNNPMNVTGGVEDGVDFDLSGFNKISDPVVWDRTIRNAAVDFIKQHPRRFFDLALLKFQKLWAISAGHRYVVVSLLTYVPIALFGLIGFVLLARERWRSVVPIVLLFGYFTAIHVITISTLRYRFPLEPFLVLFASYPLARLLRWGGLRSNPQQPLSAS